MDSIRVGVQLWPGGTPDYRTWREAVINAEELGVTVVRHSEVLPELGSFQGKGEALWKSLHVLDGDIVA